MRRQVLIFGLVGGVLITLLQWTEFHFIVLEHSVAIYGVLVAILFAGAVFLMLLFIRLYGFDFVNAAAAARVVNVATNASALAWFTGHGHVIWGIGLAMAAANVAGSQVGTRLALKRGAGFVRGAFVLVVGALIVKTAWDAARPWRAG